MGKSGHSRKKFISPLLSIAIKLAPQSRHAIVVHWTGVSNDPAWTSTSQGKEAVRFNALRHGLTSKQVVLQRRSAPHSKHCAPFLVKRISQPTRPKLPWCSKWPKVTGAVQRAQRTHDDSRRRIRISSLATSTNQGVPCANVEGALCHAESASNFRPFAAPWQLRSSWLADSLH